jgi:hypothetical protein
MSYAPSYSDVPFILTEGDLRSVLATIERRRLASGRPYCLQIHIEPGQGNLQMVRATIESLSNEMVAETRAKGEVDLNISE